MISRRATLRGLTALGLSNTFTLPSFNRSLASSGDSIIRYQPYTGGGLVNFAEVAEALNFFSTARLHNVGPQQGGPVTIQNLATGQIDLGDSFNGSLVAARGRGIKLTAVVSSSGANELSPNGFYTLEDNTIKSARDLIGRTVALNILGAAQEAFLDHYLIKGGLSRDEISQVVKVILPPATFEAALRNRRVDVVPLFGAAYANALSHGNNIRLLFSAYQLLGNFSMSTYILSNNLIGEKPELAKEIASGIGKAIAWSQDNTAEDLIKVYGEYLVSKGRQEEVKPLQSWKSAGIANYAGAISENEFSTWVQWLEETGKIAPKSVALGDVYTNALNGLASPIRPAN